MSLKSCKFAVTAALLVNCSVALAVPFASFDSRSMAMGGAGVAVGGADAAPLFNPALLSVTKKEDDFSLILPTIGMRVADPDSLRESIDNVGPAMDKLQAAVDTFNITPNSTTAAAVGTNITNVSNSLLALDRKPITAEVGLATVVGIPSKKYGAAFYATGSVTAGGLFEYNDATTLSALTTAATDCANSVDPVIKAAACNTVNNFNTNNLASGIHFKGVTLTEVGLALSHEFEIRDHNIAFGITPKIVQAQLFDTVINVNSSNQSNVSAADSIANYNVFNFDLGAAKSYENGWRTGFVIKNVLPQSLDFKKSLIAGGTPVATGETLKLNPQMRVGVSHSTSWSTVGLDVDLTSNDPAGFENKTQYIALGGELNAWDWAQVRAGYRLDMVNSSRSVASLGLGFSPFGVVHADVAVAGNANEVGASFQMGVHF